MNNITSTSHAALAKWVEDMTNLCQPADVHWCDGSQAEWDELTQLLVDVGVYTRLNPFQFIRRYRLRMGKIKS